MIRMQRRTPPFPTTLCRTFRHIDIYQSSTSNMRAAGRHIHGAILEQYKRARHYYLRFRQYWATRARTFSPASLRAARAMFKALFISCTFKDGDKRYMLYFSMYSAFTRMPSFQVYCARPARFQRLPPSCHAFIYFMQQKRPAARQRRPAMLQSSCCTRRAIAPLSRRHCRQPPFQQCLFVTPRFMPPCTPFSCCTPLICSNITQKHYHAHAPAVTPLPLLSRQSFIAFLFMYHVPCTMYAPCPRRPIKHG